MGDHLWSSITISANKISFTLECSYSSNEWAGKPGVLRNLLLSIVSHIKLNPVWVRKKICKANAKVTLRTIRLSEIKSVSLSTDSSNTSISYYGYSVSSYEDIDNGLADILRNL